MSEPVFEEPEDLVNEYIALKNAQARYNEQLAEAQRMAQAGLRVLIDVIDSVESNYPKPIWKSSQGYTFEREHGLGYPRWIICKSAIIVCDFSRYAGSQEVYINSWDHTRDPEIRDAFRELCEHRNDQLRVKVIELEKKLAGLEVDTYE